VGCGLCERWRIFLNLAKRTHVLWRIGGCFASGPEYRGMSALGRMGGVSGCFEAGINPRKDVTSPHSRRRRVVII
jgi:hypothetical protein